jgi:hypothetical protein
MDQFSTDIISKVGVNALTEVFKSCHHGLKSASKWLVVQNKTHDFFGLAANKYVEKLQNQYGTIRIMGMANPISLNKVFTQVNILEKITSQHRETVKELESTFRAG